MDLVTGGVAVGMYLPKRFGLGAWVTAALLFVFALFGCGIAQRGWD
jgi:hypothetical protein